MHAMHDPTVTDINHQDFIKPVLTLTPYPTRARTTINTECLQSQFNFKNINNGSETIFGAK